MNEPDPNKPPPAMQSKYPATKANDCVNKALRAERQGGAETIDAMHAAYVAQQAVQNEPGGEEAAKLLGDAVKKIKGARNQLARQLIGEYLRRGK